MSNIEYKGKENLEMMESAKRYNRFLLRQVIKLHDGKSKIIDFGAGNGMLAVKIRETGLTVTCIEKDPMFIQQLKELDFAVFSSLDKLDSLSQDFIYTINVLEHIQDDQSILDMCATVLKSEGNLLVYVPAFNYLFSNMDRRVGHLRRYGRSELVEKVQQAGLHIEKIVFADSLGFIITLIYKLIGSRTGDINTKTLWIYDRLLFPFSRLLDIVGLQYIFGKNLLVLAKKA